MAVRRQAKMVLQQVETFGDKSINHHPSSCVEGYFLSRIRHSKRLQADIVEFDRFLEDDPKRNIKLFTESIDRTLSRNRMGQAR